MTDTLANVATFDHRANGCPAGQDASMTTSVEPGQVASSCRFFGLRSIRGARPAEPRCSLVTLDRWGNIAGFQGQACCDACGTPWRPVREQLSIVRDEP
jgi:hypothetical protein